MSVNEVNILVLAYLGDCIYEKYVREFLIKNNIQNVNELQKASIKYVSAKNQAYYLQKMIDNCFLDENEISVVKRARNYKSGRHPKNCDIITYKHATALEALIGYYRLSNNDFRIEQIMEYILNEK